MNTQNLKVSAWRNKITDSGKPYVITEVGCVLFFGGNVQQYYEITHCENERPFSGEIDLLDFAKVQRITPIVFEKIN